MSAGLVENGIVRSEDAESHPQRHILTAALGSGRDVIPTFRNSPFLWRRAIRSFCVPMACGA